MSEVGTGEIPALECGTTLLGSGGGGPAALAANWLAGTVEAHGPVRLWQLDELPRDASVLPIGIVGATPALAEKLPSGQEFGLAAEEITKLCGASTAVLPMEIGGVNGVAVFAAAASLGLGVVDADLSGRALPRMDQLSPLAADRPLTPAALVGSSGLRVLLDGVSPAGLERLVRATLGEAGGWAAIAFGPIPVTELSKVAVLGSVGRALELGADWLTGDDWPDDHGLLAVGQVTEVSRRDPRGAFRPGTVTIVDGRDDGVLRLEMENEYLLAIRDGVVVASTPDPLCLVDRRTRNPIGCDQVRRGLDVACLRLPGFDFWWHEEHIGLVGPRAFGIDHDPVRWVASWE